MHMACVGVVVSLQAMYVNTVGAFVFRFTGLY